MCIIVVKPQGAKLPKNKVFENCFNHNSDGAGFAYLVNGNVHYQKGLMTFSDFKKALKSLDINKKDATMVFHFRIGTSGTNSKGLTHPFKICGDFDTMKITEGDGSVLFHNGILHDFNPPKDNVKDINDTMNFTYSIINNLPKGWENNDAIYTLVKKTIGSSKLAILKPNGLTMIGDFKKEDGCYFSNTSYKDYKIPVYNPYAQWWANNNYKTSTNYKSKYETNLNKAKSQLYGEVLTKDEFENIYPKAHIKKKYTRYGEVYLETSDGKYWEEVHMYGTTCYQEF